MMIVSKRAHYSRDEDDNIQLSKKNGGGIAQQIARVFTPNNKQAAGALQLFFVQNLAKRKQRTDRFLISFPSTSDVYK